MHLLWTIHGLYRVSLMDADLQLSKVGAQCFCKLVSCKIRQMVITKLTETPSPLFTIESTVDLEFKYLRLPYCRVRFKRDGSPIS